MKTILITLEYPPFHGGVADYYGNMVKSWPEPDGLVVLDNNLSKLTSKWLWPKWLPALVRLYMAVKKNNCGHIIAGHILPLGTAAYLVSRLTKTPYTVFLHGMDLTYALHSPRKKRLTKKILNRAANIICASSYTARITGEFLGSMEKIKVVNPGVSTQNATRNTQQNNGTIGERTKHLKEKYKLREKIVLFSIGRLVKRKGFDKVIEAMPEILKLVPNLHYFVAGNGPDKKYIFEKAAGVPNIIFLSELSDEDKWAWLRLCDIFIMPARKIGEDYEGFGIVYLEAGLCGKPVIAGRSGGVEDAVKGGISGMLVDPENIERIAGSVITLAQNADLRHKLGEQGRERAIKEFNWEKQAKAIFNTLTNFEIKN